MTTAPVFSAKLVERVLREESGETRVVGYLPRHLIPIVDQRGPWISRVVLTEKIDDEVEKWQKPEGEKTPTACPRFVSIFALRMASRARVVEKLTRAR